MLVCGRKACEGRPQQLADYLGDEGHGSASNNSRCGLGWSKTRTLICCGADIFHVGRFSKVYGRRMRDPLGRQSTSLLTLAAARCMEGFDDPGT